MNVCTGFVWLVIRYRSGFCEHGKEALCSTNWSDISHWHIWPGFQSHI